MSDNISQLLLIGAGPMAIDYTKVLTDLQISFITIGRGTQSANEYREKTSHDIFTGGLTAFLKNTDSIPTKAIVATGVDTLAECVRLLIQKGVKEILCEKPGGLNSEQILELSEFATKHGAKVYIAYNRRFYSSVFKAKEIITQDGGITSLSFEFTEWAHVIEPLNKSANIKANWFLANSTHVADLAFYLGGKPIEISCYKKGSLSWHPTASVFAGAGITNKNVLFSYQANWDAPGRWAVEILTNNNRLYFKPMEKLQVQKKGSVQVEMVEIDDSLDLKFKPGLYLQTKAFMEGNVTEFITLHDQSDLLAVYSKMAGYSA